LAQPAALLPLDEPQPAKVHPAGSAISNCPAATRNSLRDAFMVDASSA
jgi:hypothetical protein